MSTRALERPPRILALYARTLAPLVPGATLLPWVGGRGSTLPELELTLAGARGEPAQLARYASVCGFDPADEDLPASYPHILAFPLHLALMSDGRFPFAAVGLVHVANRIDQQRPIRAHERLDMRVYATALRPHARGRVFSLVTEARTAGELVWRERSTMLRRGSGGGQAAPDGNADAPGGETNATNGKATPRGTDAPASQEWRLAGDLGRRYAAVSGDRNPIHMHPLSARALGFPRAIAHGMWTKARSLAALQAAAAVPRGAFSVEVSFRRPILLPASVLFASAAQGQEMRFGVRDARTGTEHLDGRVRPLEHITQALEEEL
jgi:acyl dehydratase